MTCGTEIAHGVLSDKKHDNNSKQICKMYIKPRGKYILNKKDRVSGIIAVILFLNVINIMLCIHLFSQNAARLYT